MFTAALIFIIGFIIAISNLIVRSDISISLSIDSEYIILGHSHPECAFNDSLIEKVENISKSGESYFYTYFKAKKIIEDNIQVNTVFIEFENQQIDKESGDAWIFSDASISNMFSKYSPFMNISDYILLLLENSKAVLNSQSIATMRNIEFLINNEAFKAQSWGGYKFLVRDKTDSLISVMPRVNVKQKSDFEISKINIEYLEKIIAFCKSKGVNVYFIRSPLHAKYEGLINERKFMEIYNERFENIKFLDFKDYPLHNWEFGDLSHLNYKGAKEFSIFFNQLLIRKLLHVDTPQVMINKEIEIRKKEKGV